MESNSSLENLPNEVFCKILKHLSNADTMRLGEVSSGVRGKIREHSDALSTFKFKSIWPEKLRAFVKEVKIIKVLRIERFSVLRRFEIIQKEEYDETSEEDEDEEEDEEYEEEIAMQDECSRIIIQLIRKHKELKKFSILNCKNIVSDLCLKVLLSLPKLKTLTLCFNSYHFNSLTGYLRVNHQSAKLLQKVKLIRCSEFNSKILKQLFKAAPNIKTLNLAESTLRGEKFDTEYKLLKLEKLILNDSYVSDPCLSQLLTLAPNVKYLDLNSSKVIGDDFICKENLNLESLKMSYCLLLTDSGLENILEYCPMLRVLDVSEALVKKLNLGHFPKLRRLDVSESRVEKLNLGHTPNLRELDASWARVRELECTSPLEQLRSVNLKGCREVSDGFLNSLFASAPNIETLMCKETGVTGELLTCGPKLPQLVTLDLSYTGLGGKGLGTLFQLAPNLKSVNLEATAVTGENLCCSHQLSNLETINLFFCRKVTDSGLNSIMALAPNIKSLKLTNTGITGEGLTCSLSSFEDLNLKGCRALTSNGVRNILSLATRLKSLKLDQGGITTIFRDIISSYKHIDIKFI